MKILAVYLSVVAVVDAFSPNTFGLIRTSTSVLHAETAEKSAPAVAEKPKVNELGLLTFDLDDTLYPIAKVTEEANGEWIIILLFCLIMMIIQPYMLLFYLCFFSCLCQCHGSVWL
jgi:hypothetical protein